MPLLQEEIRRRFIGRVDMSAAEARIGAISSGNPAGSQRASVTHLEARCRWVIWRLQPELADRSGHCTAAGHTSGFGCLESWNCGLAGAGGPSGAPLRQMNSPGR
jgi:hypothetical protein